jgi:transcriptional regulator with XRE-family HTH domain
MDSLEDKEYRDLFVAEHIAAGLAFQIRAMREARGWSQAELGRRVGMRQETICLLENPSYGRFTLRTLKRLASAFDVALTVRFAPFDELAARTTNLSPEDLAVPAFDPNPHPTAAPSNGTAPGNSQHEEQERVSAVDGR